MNDEELEKRVRADLRVVDARAVPGALVRTAASIARTERRGRRVWWPRAIAGLAAAGATVVAVALVASLLPQLEAPTASTLRTSTPLPVAPASSEPTGTPSPSASGVSPVPTPLPSGPDVGTGAMVDALHGWAVSSRRLWVTADGGATWRDATPPGGFGSASAEYLLGVAFADAQHGWVAVNEAFTSGTDPSYGRVDIWRTTDGGQTWAKTLRPKAKFASFGDIMPWVQFDVLDATHVFAFQTGNEAKGRNDSDLFWTADGGQTWSPDRPTGTGNVGIEGTIAFATAEDGVVVNTWHGAGISVTHDGGRTWADAAWPSSAGGAAGGQLSFGPPVFFGDRTGLLTLADSSGVVGGADVYRTRDAGSSWSKTATIPTGAGAISFLEPQAWIAVSGTEVLRTADGGKTWTRSPAAGLPGSPDWLRMTDAQHGSALVWMGVCGTFKSDCNGLYATDDGGSTWRQLWPGAASDQRSAPSGS